jgi:hypothetical protein
MPAELEAVDGLLDDPRLFEPFRGRFDAELGRLSISDRVLPAIAVPETPLSARIRDLAPRSRTRSRSGGFCRIPLGESAPDPSTLMKIATRCGPELIDGLNALEAGVVDVGWLWADTTVVPADIRYPTDSGLLVRGIIKAAVLVAAFRPAVLRHAPLSRTRQARPGRPRTGSARCCASWPARRTAVLHLGAHRHAPQVWVPECAVAISNIVASVAVGCGSAVEWRDRLSVGRDPCRTGTEVPATIHRASRCRDRVVASVAPRCECVWLGVCHGCRSTFPTSCTRP